MSNGILNQEWFFAAVFFQRLVIINTISLSMLKKVTAAELINRNTFPPKAETMKNKRINIAMILTQSRNVVFSRYSRELFFSSRFFQRTWLHQQWLQRSIASLVWLPHLGQVIRDMFCFFCFHVSRKSVLYHFFVKPPPLKYLKAV